METVRILVLLLAALAAPIVPVMLVGRHIANRRRTAGLRAVAEARPVAPGKLPTEMPLDPVEQVTARAVEQYVLNMTDAHRVCTDRIGEALAAFMAGTEDHEPVQLPQIKPLPTVRIALIRLRAGIREPLCAYRPATTDTRQWSARALRELLAAEDEALVTA